MPDIVHFARTGKGIVIHCAFKEDYSADSTCDYSAKIYGRDGNLPRRTDCRCDIGPDNQRSIYHYCEKVLRNM